MDLNVKEHVQKIFQGDIPLNGLVLAGGQSTRMREDKSMLRYYNETQAEHCYQLLSPFCEQVFISNRQDQALLDGHKGLPQIHDIVSGLGPIGGILSAMARYPHTAWLVLACDLPFANERTIEILLAKRNRKKMATAYLSERDNLPEPLCAIYEPKSLFAFLNHLNEGRRCPRKILMGNEFEAIEPADRTGLENINHPHEFLKAFKTLRP